ncbi:helix-turn-helix domain-containing protein [Sphingomicrobium clamense]|uniref:Helix-turn-helix transcriptional regulator n=1 Tax=Sphingomicrobium clamense TaxID=2851013 RepID=A0ABS6V442_9SPHN|nr:helix-turn-helix transcriptional regulator [Sphingomicrobium sp. B8]MBW0144329.1 helix-turn-helix transcriptional regulator [Sphingomicrobium sp. B8]
MGLAVKKSDDDYRDTSALVAQLSEGQLEVLRMVANHMNSKEIAAELDISPHTVDQRARQAIQILGVSRRQEAARLVVQVEGPSQRLIHQSPYIPEATESSQSENTVGTQIRHASRAGGSDFAGLQTEQGSARIRTSLPLPFATGSQPRNEMGVGFRLLWIVLIAIGALFSAGMYLAGLESLARLLGIQG